MRFRLIIFIVLSSVIAGHAQEVTYNKTKLKIAKLTMVNPADVTVDWAPKLMNVEMPMPGSSRHALNEVKKQSAKKYPRAENGIQSWEPAGSAPEIGMSFPISTEVFVIDTLMVFPVAGGTPNDNTLAISDSGLVLAAFNTQLYVYDTNRDTAVMLMGLHAFSTQFSLNDKYDPKVIYDPIEDRFILVFLNGRDSYESMIIVCFSSTNDPLDPWNLYALSGNPLNDTTWTDYPAVSVTEDELFITGNLIKDTASSWQTGFSESVIWQVDKQNGYQGDSALTTTLWNDIKTDGRFIRNLHLVQGGSWPTGPSQYLLSNRNFDLLNDTIFLLEVAGTQNDPNVDLNISIGKSDVPYGVPPHGRQDHVDSLATNDARVLGAIVENGEIQFVSVTVDTLTGYCAIYHGFINDLDGTPVFTANIISDDSLDLGYPNIAYTGAHSCSRQTIIGMDHTSPERNPGISAISYHSDGTYSQLVSLKEAESAVKKSFTFPQERWGDYFGIQRRYNGQGTVWTAGFYGRTNGNYTWISELTSELEPPLIASVVKLRDISCKGNSDGSASAIVTGGFVPYTFVWSGSETSTTDSLTNVPAGDYHLVVTDLFGCISQDSVKITEAESALTLSTISVEHVTSYGANDGNATIETSGGVLPYEVLWDDKAAQSASKATSLAKGTYIVSVTDSGECLIWNSVTIEEPLPISNIFPNPAIDIVTIYFELGQPGEINVELYDSKGAVVQELFSGNAKAGSNIFTFSSSSLAAGTYILRVFSGEKLIITEKILKG